MSLVISSGGSINHGQGTGIDDVPGGGAFSIATLVYRTSDGTNQHIFTMDGVDFASRAGCVLFVDTDSDVRLLVRRATTDTDFQSNSGVVALNAWTFIAATWEDALATEVDIYTGSLTAAATEVTYASTTNGSGATTADNANDKWVGNLERANTLPFLGRIARLGYYNSRLTLGQIRALQFAPIREWRLPGTALLADYVGPGSQLDYSGNGRKATVTNGRVAAHVPLERSRRRFELYAPSAAAGANPARGNFLSLLGVS